MKKILFIVASIVLLLAACSGGNPGVSASSYQKADGYKAVMKQQPIQPVGEDFVAGVNSFGLKSAGLLYTADKNLAVSPVSLELALAMTRAGAAGQTADGMKAALFLEGISNEDIKSACRSLMWRSNTGGMKAANAVWVGEGLTLSDGFAKTCTEDFMADAFPLVIPGAMDTINEWAGDKTDGRIDKIISEELDPGTRMVLTNAMLFLGDWTVPFKAEDTYDEQFRAPGGGAQTPFMHSTRSVPYYETDEFSMITLDFKSKDNGGRYSMAFILPAEGSSPEQLLASLSGEAFSNALSGTQNRETIISLPKFEFSYFNSLKDMLIDMGMGTAFGGGADFSNMTKEPNALYISDVLHKCFVKVDELGAEAAAVTVVPMNEGMAMPPENTAVFRADRPFLFAIYSQEDGAIAFLGAVNDPTQE
jgi:serine protease inhibitor